MSFGAFDGSFARGRDISLRGSSKKEDKASLLLKAREKREARLRERKRTDSALLIQVSL
jgi:hypothetical protein